MTHVYSNTSAHSTVTALRSQIGDFVPRVAVILGSGLGGLSDHIDAAMHVPYAAIPGLPNIHVAGHASQLVAGTLDGVPVLLFSGRYHLYEGHSAQLAAFPVRLAHALGARTLVVSNAVGAINPALAPGDLMIITDHLNLMGTSPLVGPLQQGDIRFPDMSDAYDPALRAVLRDVAFTRNLPIHEGIYAALLGPAYETPAEIRMLRTLGADAVCMSTVPEVIVARALRMRVAGVSCVTNMACGVTSLPLDHDDVLRMTARAAVRFQTLVRGLVATL